MTDGAGTETRAYDNLNRLTRVTRGTDTFAYLYDLAANLTRRTYPDGTITDYTFDDDSRMVTVSSGGATTSYGYDAAGNRTTTTLPAANGHLETRTYDRAGRLTRMTSERAGTTLVDFAYSLDAVGNPTQVVRAGSLTGTSTYTYDDRHQLTEVCYATGCPGASDYIRWSYDPVGNRLTESRPSGVTTYTYDGADRLTVAGSTSYTYDSNGNRTGSGTRTFAYDLAARMISTSSEDTTTAYSYDGAGRRSQAVTGTQVVNYTWDPNHNVPQLAQERDGSNALIRRYIYGKERLSSSVPGVTSYYHHDRLGSVADVTSSTGATERSYAYEPFGATLTETSEVGEPPVNLHRFGGEMQDTTGLYHLRARQYDPSTGTFTNLDPRERPATEAWLTSYSYSDNRPTVLTDPTGESATPSDGASKAMSVAVDAVQPERLLSTETDHWVRGKILREARSQTTLIRGHHTTGTGWLVSQEVEWGQVNVRSAFIKTARFRYYLPLGNVLLGGAASIYAGHNQHKNYRADFNKPYVAESPQSIYAGSYFLPVYRWWSGGGINGNLLVFIDKHTQLGDYSLGDDFHGKFTVGYGVR